MLVGVIATAVLLVVMLVTAVFSPILALRQIQVTGTSQLDPAAIEQAVSDQIGTPLALLDEGRLRDELASFDLIRSYSTEIVPPDTLVLRIDERQPLALLPAAGEYLTVDAAGVVLSRAATRPEGVPLVVLDPASGVDPEHAGSDPAFEAAVRVLLALPPSVAGQVDRIAARTRDDVAFTIAGTDQRVVWGSAEDAARKARTLEVLYAQYSGSGPGEYNVSGADSAVFRTVDLAAEEAAAQAARDAAAQAGGGSAGTAEGTGTAG
ncbi:MAG: FtsQ-type POTRA domain-containing protein [Actinomycetales bacterium]|nr:FtsQ-type POTRA domain-containing protein [Actinomycetales bacterium]